MRAITGMSQDITCPTDALIIRLSSFGDVVLTEPVTRSMKDRWPDCRLWFVTGDAYEAIPHLFSAIDTVVPYSRDGSNENLRRLSRDVEFDVIIDLQNNVRSRRISGMCSAKTVLRHRRQRFKRFLSVYLPWIWKGDLKPVVETYFDVVRPVGIDSDYRAPMVAIPMETVEVVGAAFGGGTWVAVCPGGSSQYKRWGEPRFAELVRRLQALGHNVILVGSETDRAVIDSMLNLDPSIDVKTHIGDDVAMTACVLSLCDVTVSNDSGLMHLADAAGSRVVTIFGPTSPILGFAPARPGSVLLTGLLDCSPCSFHGNRPCKYDRPYCMEAIEPAAVASVVNDLLQEKVST